jgi:hypothetical protein
MPSLHPSADAPGQRTSHALPRHTLPKGGALSQFIGAKSQEIKIASPLSTALSTARSLSGFGMDDRIIDILAALYVAAVTAVTAWFVAQYVFGLSSPDIRRSALTGAAIFALLLATLWFAKLLKSK